MKGVTRKNWKINNEHYTKVVDIEPVVFIQSKSNPLLFYNEFHKMFVTLNLADRFTTKKANELIKGLIDCEKVTFEKIKLQLNK